MANYWVKNENGTILGPLGLQVLRDLGAAGKLGSVMAASTDGRTWSPLRAFPELGGIIQAAAAPAPPAAEASEVRRELAAIRGKPWHQVFGVPAGASREDYRTAFFAKVKRYHPQRLPPSASAETRAACAEMFKFLSDAMMAVQNVQTTPLAPRDAARSPTFRAAEFVGLVEGPDRVQATICLGPKSVELFTTHKLANITTCSFFLAERRLALGRLVDVTLTFEGEPRTLKAHGRVVLESAGDDPRQPRGSGIQLNLSSTDRAFLQGFVASVAPKS
jgi:hypothetical protein